MSAPNRDRYAREVLRAGRDMGIAPRGIVIGFATVAVECDWWMYANRKVPESLTLPHERVGDDGYSVGLFQQQIRRGAAGQWWWADCATCMDPYRSARLFFERLARLPYQSGGKSPGTYAQDVQKSAFPDRYDQRMGEAQALYDRLAGAGQNGGTTVAYYDTDRSAEFSFGGPRPTSGIVGICIHTTESGKSATATPQTADDVTSYQVRTQTGSYHVMVGVDGKRILQNTDDWITWSTGNKGNNILLHLCLVGNASQTRAEWLAQDKMLRAAATVVKHWAEKYRIPLRKVDAAGLPGIVGHIDTRVWGGTDHTDPGQNFPYDRIIQLATDGGTPMPNQPLDAQTAAGLGLDQLAGPNARNGAGFPGWPCLGDRTVVEALAVIGEHLGIDGFKAVK